MIAVCSKCGKCWETSEEDANTPGVLCPACYHARQEEAPGQVADQGNGGVLDLDALAEDLDAEKARRVENGGTERGIHIDPEGRGWGVF
jgi:hypothetical protein